MRSVHEFLDTAAVQAVSRWRYAPTTFNGERVPQSSRAVFGPRRAYSMKNQITVVALVARLLVMPVQPVFVQGVQNAQRIVFLAKNAFLDCDVLVIQLD